MDINYLTVTGGPLKVGPFSHAVRAGDFLFITGQVPTLKNDNSIRLEFKAITRYTKKSNIKYKKKSKPISIISISKFFRDNYKYIIV